ncbi:hypothetical protein HELRODRAFT_177275 [Helobdella robusta]|uniref:Uncharacterized protein n=1 Tax=Helobdella robusta TaxID=6412 RepID=T1FBF9_HELRO|nr:hypothetical protein HELRODRAFT_177275 [Helobdella robusta]ESN98046.1 hypothetical protein HELRODRAFT_177275 [Helobdella robusta]
MATQTTMMAAKLTTVDPTSVRNKKSNGSKTAILHVIQSETAEVEQGRKRMMVLAGVVLAVVVVVATMSTLIVHLVEDRSRYSKTTATPEPPKKLLLEDEANTIEPEPTVRISRKFVERSLESFGAKNEARKNRTTKIFHLKKIEMDRINDFIH